MAAKTTNYGLIKPEPSDFYNVETQHNANMDIIDKTLKEQAHSVITNGDIDSIVPIEINSSEGTNKVAISNGDIDGILKK